LIGKYLHHSVAQNGILLPMEFGLCLGPENRTGNAAELAVRFSALHGFASYIAAMAVHFECHSLFVFGVIAKQLRHAIAVTPRSVAGCIYGAIREFNADEIGQRIGIAQCPRSRILNELRCLLRARRRATRVRGR